jgi:hypothetical protein
MTRAVREMLRRKTQMGISPLSPWRFVNNCATATWSGGKLAVEPLCPRHGAKLFLQGFANGSAGNLFGMPDLNVEPDSPIDQYLRGDDFVVGYPATIKQPIATKVYWRWLGESAGITSLELIYSLQTQLWESYPQANIISQLRCRRGLIVDFADLSIDKVTSGRETSEQLRYDDHSASSAVGPCGVLAEFPEGQRLIMALYQGDQREISIQRSAHEISVHFGLRTDLLEKGVIRRARLMAAFGSAGVTDNRLFAAAGKFMRSEIPLTT